MTTGHDQAESSVTFAGIRSKGLGGGKALVALGSVPMHR